METKHYYPMDDEILDIRELMLFILRKWKILILAGIIGVVLGCGINLLMPEKHIEDFDLAELHLEEIAQYARYHKLYDEQLRVEDESVYMNMDPQNVHMGSKIYYLAASETDINHIGEMYHSILRDERIYDELIAASGLNCSEMAMQELVLLSFTKYKLDTNVSLLGNQERDAVITINTYAPNADAGLGMMTLLDERVQEVNRLVQSRYPNVLVELMSDSSKTGYDAGVMEKRSKSADVLSTYVTQMEKLEGKLSEDDLLYYGEVYAVEEEKGSLTWLKWGLILGVLFGGLAVVFYGVMYLLDGHVKTIDEIKRIYGLHLIACLSAKKKAAGCAIDRMLMPRYRYNSEDYLKAALAEMDVESIHVCGDMENVQIAAGMQAAAGQNITVSAQMAVDAKAQQMAKAADGVVLFVQLWNTKHNELARELELAHHIHTRVLGVVVIG